MATTMIHLYGFIIGLAMVVGWWLAEYQARRHQLPVADLQLVIGLSLVGGLIGARLYHVGLEFEYYRQHWVQIFQLWRGGSSIIGGLIGGLLTVWLVTRVKTELEFRVVLDLAALVLPMAQAVGRWGNFVNQELYGRPMSLPWGIFIDSSHRLAGFEHQTHFHPLFIYESLLLLLFAGGLWWWDKQERFSGFSLGTGRYFFSYIFYYSFIRFWLDFLRIDKTHFFNTFLGVNQILLLGIMLSGAVLWVMNYHDQN